MTARSTIKVIEIVIIQVRSISTPMQYNEIFITVKMTIFIRKLCQCVILLTFAQNIDYGYSIDPLSEADEAVLSSIHNQYLKAKIRTSSLKGNDRSPESKQVFLNSSQVSKGFFQLVKGS